jgi:hypothetical protein
MIINRITNRISTRTRTARRSRVSEYALDDSELFMNALQAVQRIAEPPRAVRW